MALFTLSYYRTASGKIPYEEWLKRLKDKVARTVIARRLTRIEVGEFGDHKVVGGGVSELRVALGPGYRVYYGTMRKTAIIILIAGDKGSQARDIERSKVYWIDYQQRHDKE